MYPYSQANRAIQVDLLMGGDPDMMLIRGFHGTEAVSRLYEYRLDLALQASGMPFDFMLGKKISVSLQVNDEQVRKVNGIVAQLSRGTRDETFLYLRAILRPRIWCLTKTWNSRIYQEKTVVDILQDVVKGFLVDYSRLQPDEFEPHNYRVQYRESDFNFASRLMEEAGICYFFEQSNTQERMVLMNARSSNAHPAMPLEDTAEYQEEQVGAAGIGPRINSWEKVQDFASGVERFRDHHFQIPSNHLNVEEFIRESIPLGTNRVSKEWLLQVANNDDMEVYDYPGDFAKYFDEVDRQGNIDQDRLKVMAEGAKVARLQMEQEESGSLMMAGLSDCRQLTSGYKFQLTGHFEDSDMYMMTEVEHSCSQPILSGSNTGPMRYGNRFTCIPGNLPYRPYDPALSHPVAATQTAKVVGPLDHEIFTDRYGRVKVHFFWDRNGVENQNSSCWLRVAQPWAGKGWGHQWIPRIGQEVIVDYLDGDMDRPIITGSVYNKDNPPPWIGPTDNAAAASAKATQSGIQTRSTPGGSSENYNELRFEDKKGHEVVFLHAERNLATSVENCETHSVGVNQTITVGNDRKITVGGVSQSGANVGDEKEKIFHDKHLHVMGNTYTTIDGATNLHVKSTDTSKYDANRNMEVAGGIVVSADSIELSANTSITFIVGGNSIVLDASGITVIGVPLIKLNPMAAPMVLPTMVLGEVKDAIDP
jgi:type VI secretion system secreted protein VgrG